MKRSVLRTKSGCHDLRILPRERKPFATEPEPRRRPSKKNVTDLHGPPQGEKWPRLIVLIVVLLLNLLLWSGVGFILWPQIESITHP